MGDEASTTSPRNRDFFGVFDFFSPLQKHRASQQQRMQQHRYSCQSTSASIELPRPPLTSATATARARPPTAAPTVPLAQPVRLRDERRCGRDGRARHHLPARLHGLCGQATSAAGEYAQRSEAPAGERAPGKRSLTDSADRAAVHPKAGVSCLHADRVTSSDMRDSLATALQCRVQAHSLCGWLKH